MTVLIEKSGECDAKRICDAHANRPDALIEILREVQAGQGFLGEDVLREIARQLNISLAEIHGVVTFYHDFRRAPPARHTIKICRAEACQAVGADSLVAHAETVLGVKCGEQSVLGQFELLPVYCLGNCALGPAVLVGDELRGRISHERFDRLINDLRDADDMAEG